MSGKARKGTNIGDAQINGAVRALVKTALAKGVLSTEILPPAVLTHQSLHHFLKGRGISVERAILLLEFLLGRQEMSEAPEIAPLLGGLREKLAEHKGGAMAELVKLRDHRASSPPAAKTSTRKNGRPTKAPPALPHAVPHKAPEQRASRADLAELRRRLGAAVQNGEKLPELARRCETTTKMAKRVLDGGSAKASVVAHLLARVAPVSAPLATIGLAPDGPRVDDSGARQLVASFKRAALLYVLREANQNIGRKLGTHEQ